MRGRLVIFVFWTTLMFACRSVGPAEVGGPCGELPYEGVCTLAFANIGPHPNDPNLAILNTTWEGPKMRGQTFTCGPAFAVPKENAERLKAHVRSQPTPKCKGTWATGSCNPCPGAKVDVELSPFDGEPLVPIDRTLVRF